ncbi:MAG: hypothetical protein RR621_03465 [Lachnospiraceae bacterium]
MIKKRVIGVMVVITLGILFYVGYTNINQKYPKSIEVTASIGESQLFSEGNKIRVTKMERLDAKAEESMGIPKTDLGFERKIYLVYCTFSNETKEKQELNITDCYIETTGWGNGLQLDLYLSLNPKEQTTKMMLEGGESKEVILPYQILSNGFQEKEWKKIDSRKFRLLYSEYPIKYSISLQHK